MLDDGLVFFSRVGELAAFPYVVGNGLLDVGVFAVGGSGGGDECVEVVGGCDDNCIDVLGLADLAVIIELGDLDAFLFEFCGEAVEDFGIDIAEGDDLRSLCFEDIVSESFSTAVKADDAYPEVAVGTGCGAGECGAECEGTGEGGGG